MSSNLEALQCNNCQKVIFPKRKFCNNCRSTNLNNFTISRTGKLYSFTTVHYPLSKYDNPPYYVGLVSLNDNTLKVTARIEAKNKEDIKLDQEVEVSIKNFPESGSLPIVVAKILQE